MMECHYYILLLQIITTTTQTPSGGDARKWGEVVLQRIQQTYWPIANKDRMKGALAELHNHIMRKFEFFSNDVPLAESRKVG